MAVIKISGELERRYLAARTKLETATDSLNEALEQAEAVLSNLKLGVHASVPLDSRHIGFGKLNSNWKLLLEQRSSSDAEIDISPLMNANREIRMKAVTCLPALLIEMVRVAEVEAEEVATAATKANDFVKSVIGA